MLWAVLGSYAIACALYLGFLVHSRPLLGSVARGSLALAVAIHALDIGIRCTRGLHPIATVPEALSFVAWLLASGFLLASLRYPIAVVGGFVAPTVLVLLALARLTPTSTTPVAHGLGTLGRVHITLSTAGVAFFALAAALAVIYLAVEAQLKSKRTKSGLLQQSPPLALLDTLGHRCVTIGFPLFTAAIVTGAIWVARLPRQSGLGLRPEYSLSVVAWLFFGALLLARGTAGWQGRRAAWLTLVGFGGTLAVLLVYLIRYAGGG